MVHTVECPYQPTDLATGPRTEWIRYMLRDMGVMGSGVDKRVQEAVEKYIVDFVETGEEIGKSELTMGDLESMAHAFWHGYEQAYRDLGMLKSRSDGEPHSKE